MTLYMRAQLIIIISITWRAHLARSKSSNYLINTWAVKEHLFGDGSVRRTQETCALVV